MEKENVIRFFDACAPDWDANMVRPERVIAAILDGARVGPGSRVLDVACGTGVLFPDYLARGAAHVTAIDISPRMAELARAKCPGAPIEVVCGDVETHELPGGYDCVMVYNAFPHFPHPAHLIARLAELTCPGGTLTVAHGMSRERLRRHHAGSAQAVSIDLLSADELRLIFAPWFDVTVCASDDEHYQVTGVRRESAAACLRR